MASDGEVSCTTDPNFAVIYSFLKVFGKLYGLEIPTITKLQELVENTEEVLNPLKELHLRLLRRALKSVPSDRWERGLIKFCHQHGHHQEAWEIERFSYKKASTTVKLKVLKILLEYQFTCHSKFKTAVNAITCKELRLDPIGRDKNGCVYWLQVDHEANLCLYKEDQDEETWQLIARNREELVKVISQLKNGEEISPSAVNNANEDSNSTEPPLHNGSSKIASEENDEEFLSPESESEHEQEHENEDRKSVKDENVNEKSTSEDVASNEQESNDTKQNSEDPAAAELTQCNMVTAETIENESAQNSQEHIIEVSPEDITRSAEVIIERSPGHIASEDITERSPEVTTERSPKEIIKKSTEVITENFPEVISDKCPGLSTESEAKKESNETSNAVENQPLIQDIEKEKPNSPQDREETDKSDQKETVSVSDDIEKSEASSDFPKTPIDKEKTDTLKDFIVSKEIVEPLMIVTGEGNGADCESSYIIGEEIEEEIIYFYGYGSGYDNDTGNTEAIEQGNNAKYSEEENGDECVNGENHSSNTKSVKNVKLKGKSSSVTKRSLKKQSNDNSEILKPDTKKHCVRSVDKSDCSNSNSTSTPEKELRSRVNNKTPDSEVCGKNNVKKGRNKVKKNVCVNRRLNVKEKKSKEAANSEKDSVKDSKTSIIEKRKSSLSSEDQEDEQEKETTPDISPKVEEALPPKKIRLETTEGDSTISHSNDVNTVDNVNNDKNKQNDIVELNVSISQRKKIKATKGKFKRKKFQNRVVNDEKEDEKDNDSVGETTVKSKSLKRSLLDATLSDKNKSESHTESEDDEPVSSGKRLKIKPKKIVKASRRKIEAKLKVKPSSEESEEETLYSLGKKCAKKSVKKKPKVSKGVESCKKSRGKPDSESDTPVRQSRRIAQLKIREEAERRHLEEVTLRELKMIHKKKGKEDEDWQHSDSSHSSSWSRKKPRRPDKWQPQDSSGNDHDSESDEPLFDHHEHEPDLNFSKSDHEFSPESDLETDEPVEPLKRARTLQEEKDEGFCLRCGSATQPEWILLCDRCDAGYHAACLKPVLFQVPAGDWFCPPCSHVMLIESLESELSKFDELLVVVEEEKAKRKQEALEKQTEEDTIKKEKRDDSEEEGSSDYSSSSEEEAVYRLRARRQLPVSYRAQEYDRLISSAIKEEYVEPTTSAGNQGRGKDISTIIEAAEEEKMKAEREAVEQGKSIEKKVRKKQRKKPRKLNSLDVPSEDDDETDEDFKDTGMESSSEEISSSAERGTSSHSGSSDDLPIRRACRTDKKDRQTKMIESSPDVKKKKKGVFNDSSSESGEKEWNKKKKSKVRRSSSKKREKSSKKKRNRLTQYDAEGNVVRSRVTYGGLSDEPNDWSPKHRTRQKKINYTEMPNTESEDEMHKSSGKHMADSSDEFKIEDSDFTTDSDSERLRKKRDAEQDEEKRRALDDLIKKTAVVPLEKLPEDVTKAKTEELQAHLEAQALAEAARQAGEGRGGRGRGGRGRGGRGGGRGRGRGISKPPDSDDALARLVGVKIKDFNPDGTPKPLNPEREKKKQEREAKLAEKEARKVERLQKKEEKEKLKEMKAKEREEKKQAKLALQESKRIKKEKPEFSMGPGAGFGPRPEMRVNMFGGTVRQNDFPEQGYPATPRLQVRAELRGVLTGDIVRPEHHQMREVAGSPQPFKPVSEEPSIITRMPHMLNQQYRGPLMYQSGNPPYGGGRGPQGMYQMHPGLPQGVRPHYSQFYPHMRPQYQGMAHPGQMPAGTPHHPGQGGPHPGPHPGQAGPHPGQGGPQASPRHLLPQHPPQPAHPGQAGPPHPGQRPAHPHPGIPPHPRLQGHPPGHPGQALPPAHANRLTHPGYPGMSHSGPPGHSTPPSHLPPNHPGHNIGPPQSRSGHPGSPPSHSGPPPNHPGHPGPPPNHQRPPSSHSGHPGPPSSHPGHLAGPPGHPGHIPPGHATPPAHHNQPHPSQAVAGHPGLPRPRPAGSPGLLRALPPGLLAQRYPPPRPGYQPRPAEPNDQRQASPPGGGGEPVKIKTEVKTEPEYQSPGASPRPASPPRPKVKHTPAPHADKRPRFPLGPYAPQYAPYGPYAPPAPYAAPDAPHAALQRLHHMHALLRPPPAAPDAPPGPPGPPGPHYAPYPYPAPAPAPAPHYAPPEPGPAPKPPEPQQTEKPPSREPTPVQTPNPPEKHTSNGGQSIPQKDPTGPPPIEDTARSQDSQEETVKPEEPIRVKEEIKTEPPIEPPEEQPPREEGSVFGGLVSYFSSQREDDDIDT